MKTGLVVLLLSLFFSSLIHALTDQEQFSAFVKKYNKSYHAREYKLRFANFQASLARIEAKNARNGTATWGVTKFSDMSVEEFQNTVLMPKGSVRHQSNVAVLQPRVGITAPATFDWRDKGAVTDVKDQGQCGSCWAFSVTENIESVWIIAGHGDSSSVDLAPQQIVDCDTSDSGCSGGDPPTAYQYVMSAGGLEDENDYPYTAQDGNCNFNSADVEAKISNWQYATQNSDENTLQANLVSWAPLSICVDASSWQDYTGGVVMAADCGNDIDHCVQLIGYDTTASTPNWFVRNSWGTDWGDNGYIYLQMFQDTCSMADEATTAVA